MSVISIDKDPERLTMTVIAEYAVSAERAWELWSDPRQLERWWGPPTHPATVEEHDLVPGGTVTYYMTGPEGDRYRGWWRVLEVEPARLLVVQDGFADEYGQPAVGMPSTMMRVRLEDQVDGVVVTIESTFESLEAMEQLIAMGMEDGLRAAMGQIDAILVE